MRPLKVILEMLFWMLAAGLLLFGIGTAVGLIIAPVLGYVAAALVLGLLPLITHVAHAVRLRRGAMLLGYLEQAVRLNLPLSRMLYVAQVSERGGTMRRLGQLRQLLEEGYPIGSAVGAAVPEISERQAAMIEVGERIGRLPQTLRKLLREQSAEAVARNASEMSFYRAYAFVMVVMLTAVTGMVMVFVIPKYESIFRDFNQKLPPITVFVLDVARTIGPLLLAGVAAATLFWTGLSLWQTFHPVRFTSIIGRGVRDRLVWATPLARGIAHHRALGDAFGVVADALRVGATADRALAEAAQLDVNEIVRRRLENWSSLVARGAPLADAAQAVRMPPLVSGMLAGPGGSVTGSSAVEVFAFLARYYDTRFSRLAALVEAAVVPLLVLFFGVVVACIALALLQPMITLIDAVSPTVHLL